MYICLCEPVTDKQLRSAILDGASTMRELRQKLGVVKQCGRCAKATLAILEETLSGQSDCDSCGNANSCACASPSATVAHLSHANESELAFA